MHKALKKITASICAAAIGMSLVSCGWADNLYELYAADQGTRRDAEALKPAEYVFTVTFDDKATQEEKKKAVAFTGGTLKEEKASGEWKISVSSINSDIDELVQDLKDEFDCIESVSVPINTSSFSN